VGLWSTSLTMAPSFFRRTIEYALTLVIALSLNFFLPRWMPGDPVALIAGSAVQQMGEEKINELRAAYGLDKPLGQQYLVYLHNLLRGDLGQSYRYSGGRGVTEVISTSLGWTLLLVVTSLTLAGLLGSALGAWAAWQRGRGSDLGLLTGLFTLRSVPSFWLAMILIPVFAVQLRWFPAGDSYSFPRLAGWQNLKDIAYHAVLPVITLTLAYLPTAFAVMRAAMLDVLGADYIRTARAKGASEKLVLYRHAMRNALLPVVTSFALDFGQLLGGVTLIETVFNYRGIGLMMFEAVRSRDYPLLQGGFLVFTIGVIGVNLLTEWLYPRLDPRVRREAA
jgi:peptide/nickel transport system permease protein